MIYLWYHVSNKRVLQVHPMRKNPSDANERLLAIKDDQLSLFPSIGEDMQLKSTRQYLPTPLAVLIPLFMVNEVDKFHARAGTFNYLGNDYSCNFEALPYLVGRYAIAKQRELKGWDWSTKMISMTGQVNVFNSQEFGDFSSDLNDFFDLEYDTALANQALIQGATSVGNLYQIVEGLT